MTPEEKLTLLKSGGKLLTNGQVPTMVAPTGQETVPINPNKNYGYNAQTKELTGASSATGLNLVKEAQKTVAELKGTPPVPAPELPEQPQTKDKPTVDKSLTLINSNGQRIKIGDPDINRQQVQNAVDSGFTVEEGNAPEWLKINESGGAYIAEKTDEELRLEKNRTDYDNAIAKINNFDVSKDPALQSLLSGITNSWNQRIAQMEQSAKSQTEAAKTMGYKLGGYQYSGGSLSPIAGIVSTIEQNGINKIADLEVQKNSALAEATMAYANKEWSKYVDLVSISDKKYQESVSELNKLNENIISENKARDDLKFKREQADIQNEADAIKAQLESDKFTFLQKQTLAENSIAEGKLKLDEWKSIQDINIKREELKTKQKEAQKGLQMAGLDPADPDYISKVIASSAGGKKVDVSTRNKISKALTVVGQLSEIQKNIADADTGPIVGIFRSANPYDVKAQLIKAQLQAIIPNLARGVYGEVGVLTDNDVALYSRTLPNLKSTKELRNLILASTLKTVQRSIENELEIAAGTGLDVSGLSNIWSRVKSEVDKLNSSIGITPEEERLTEYVGEFKGSEDPLKDYINSLK